ncbi:hypothetical protein MA16_Dca009413 [Dendrobium catenatum]|uniref:Uncharacterized protein n=2 Tax=Dendrobium catenatum TaxID=906689 RepID=A0A2I0XH74_9ASPA|nr:hypothetical protein MA16_Dca009413 [Dendrobium catenatum]
MPECFASTNQPTPAGPGSQVSFATIPVYFTSTHQQTHVETFSHVPFSNIPECFTDEWLLRRPTSQPNPEYLNMMNGFIDAERLG